MIIEQLAAAADATSIEGIFLQYGLIGAVALALGIYARSAIKGTEERARRLEDDNRKLYQIMTDQMIPALTRATDTTMEATEVLTDIQRRDEHEKARQAALEEARRLAGLDRHDGAP